MSRDGEDEVVAPIDALSGAQAPVSAEPVRVAALGYVTSSGATRLDDTEVTDQVAAIERFCAQRGWDLATLVHEVGAMKSRSARPALTYALERMSVGDISRLLVTDLGRLCTTVAQLPRVVHALDRAGARLVSLNPALDTSTESGKAAMEILCAIGGWERDRAAERSRAALAAARARGAIQPAIEPDLKRRIERMRGAGMTLQAIVDDLNADGVPTVRGGALWRPSSIQAAVGYRRQRIA
ncbi:MAG TPA: recombinase family protein [Thermoleophilaceae bacterium]